MSPHFPSSADTHAMIARVAPSILELLRDGLPRSRPEITSALAEQHTKDEVRRALMRLAVTGQLVESKRKFQLPSAEQDMS